VDPAEAGPRPPAVAEATGARAVLWDLDGTLVDSVEEHWQAWRETVEADGLAVTRERFRETFGQRNDAILARWFGDAVAPERRRAIGHAKEARYRELVAAGGLAPLPGAAEWVRRLARAGWRQAVASSAPRLNVDVVVRALGLSEFFGALVAAEDVVHGKPAPDVFLAAAARLEVPAAGCVVVEDAAAGIEAARRAGMRNIGIGSPGFAPADVVVASLDRLPADAFDRLLADRPAPAR
jgi:beta-phosphoglucomutase